MIKKSLMLTFTLVIVLTLVAGAADGEFSPVTFVDDADQNITITERPNSFVSLAPSITEILFALGVDDRLIGVSNYCDYPQAALEKPKIGDINIDFEAILVLDPDVIFTMFGMEDQVERLRDLGFLVVVVEPESLEQVKDRIVLLGQITGAEQEANELTADMAARIARVKARAAQTEYQPRVFYEVWDDPLMTAGPGTFIHDLIEVAGGINIGENLKQPWSTFSLEELFMANPDVILVSWDDYEHVLDREGWQNLQAVQKKQVFWIHQDLISRPGPRIIEGLEQIQRAILLLED